MVRFRGGQSLEDIKMAFPASTITQSTAWASITGAALRIKSQVETLRNLSAAGDTGRTSYVALQRQLDNTVENWNTASAVPGLEAYARDQINDQALNLTAEFIAMRNAALALRDWIFNNIPTDSGSGAALLRTVGADGEMIELTFTTGQTAGFRTQADAFVATIG